jgi:hypothetical protein
MAGRWVDVAEAARELDISTDAVRKRIARGSLESDRPDGNVLVWLDDGGTEAGREAEVDGVPLVEVLREQVAYLRGVISTRDQELALRAEEIRRRDTALEREQQLAAMFAERLRELEAPVGSSEARDSDVSPGPSGELGEVREELDTERTRRKMAESTLHEGMTEEQRRREEAEQERDDLRRELYALKEAPERPETAEEQQGRGQPHSATVESQERVQRPWWRRVFGR